METGKTSTFPLGVDLIELNKAKFFYRSHKQRLNSLFSGKELSYIRKSKKPYESLGVLLAAKEAAFKALPPSETGIADFRNIEILTNSKDGFQCRLAKDKRETKLKFSVFKNQKVVVVRCAGI